LRKCSRFAGFGPMGRPRCVHATEASVSGRRDFHRVCPESVPSVVMPMLSFPSSGNAEFVNGVGILMGIRTRSTEAWPRQSPKAFRADR